MQLDKIDNSFKELDDNELRETNGGIGPLVIIGIIIVGAFVIGCVKGCSDEAQK
jgi:lactobin A/cerein 7B family class IIb bacteriocin